ncbi:MAG: BMP family ABC transporter substrate-binding protein [Clostridium argentinense]|uniref:BMP family ABC transporter substrate-binding protein n=1 Tax=Clostridium faecium TaxID=2762223 RepID=A0ABR8YWM5_9CLOT|nr:MULTISPECIES: BMP family ABC transporter substrate-binding protein [Clostridium]MBD8048234.1 BMP family ABC transporter substrate-binding protein [Clostridium faecium]MBS5823296.1 BMP family ABC transporter substrate-binding protein [Clostridium argentinense]MDU1349061.1 BMP family ABC transporter substrate-binding protein [Clostridium argentinense]
MKMKRLVAVLTSAILTAGILGGCGSAATDGNDGSAASGEEKKSEIMIGLATDEGGLNDKSFNQSADEGVKKAVEEFGVKYKPIESKKKEDYEPNLQALVDAGADLSFAIGYQLDKATTNAAENNPENKFAIIDAVVDAPNVMSITFKEEEGSFLMGVIAGKMTKSNQIGFIGGKDIDTIQKFESGFVAGVKAVNPEAAKLLESPDGEKPGKNVKYADSFDDSNKGYELAKSLYNAGCDVIYHSAGGVGIGMFKAAQELKDSGKEVWAIGVDKDQAVSVPEYAGVILSSMIKRVDVGTYNATKDVVNGEFKSGHTVLGLKDGGVGIAETTEKNTPKDVVDLAKDYEQKIIKGEIKAPATREEAKNFK